MVDKKFKGILQHDAKDCGAACLTSILNYFGNKVTLSEVREGLKVDKSGTNLLALNMVSEDYGLYANPLSGNFNELIKEIRDEKISLPYHCTYSKRKTYRSFHSSI